MFQATSPASALDGQRVRLEPLGLEHVDVLCAVGLDAELWRWTPAAVQSSDEMRDYVQAALDAAARGGCLPYVIMERATGTAVGSTRIAALDLEHRRCEIGWTWVAIPWQRTYVNTEAKLLLLAHAFDVLGCHRVEFRTDALNQRSRKAIERLGASEEGILRKHVLTQSGRIRDTVVFSILDTEWPAVQAQLRDRLAKIEQLD